MVRNDFPENFVFRWIRFRFFGDMSPFIMMKFARQSRVPTLMSKHWFWLFGFFPLLIKSMVFFLVFFIFLVFTVVIFLYKITKNISFILGIFAKKKTPNNFAGDNYFSFILQTQFSPISVSFKKKKVFMVGGWNFYIFSLLFSSF